MSYQEKLVWTIQPKESYKVVRSCSKCGCKSKYVNTGNFRVNANGNSLDIWLIYQCEKCKTTLNLSIFERVKPNKVPKTQYQKFLSNDEKLAFEYGVNKELFQTNKAEIDDDEIEYEVIVNANIGVNENTNMIKNKSRCDKTILINNPYSLKIRLEKLISKQFEISRMQIKKLVECGIISNEDGRDLKKIIIYDGLEVTIRNLNDMV
ncbi:MAG: DUF1062 domain-containing protein [Lachnotalea sp.]